MKMDARRAASGTHQPDNIVQLHLPSHAGLHGIQMGVTGTEAVAVVDFDNIAEAAPTPGPRHAARPAARRRPGPTPATADHRPGRPRALHGGCRAARSTVVGVDPLDTVATTEVS